MNKQDNSRLKVGVFMGGRSVEREASFNSGRTICDHLDSSLYEIIPIFQNIDNKLYILPLRFLHRGKISDFENRLASEAELINWDKLKLTVDFVYIAQHGKFAEDGTLQGFLEILQIPYLGSKVLASALSMDKIMQKKILEAENIKIPKAIIISPEKLNSKITNNQVLELLKSENINLPVIIKPYKEGSSLGISVVFNENNLLEKIEYACSIDSYKKQEVIIEQYLEGLEFTCIIITDYKTGKLKPMPITEIVIEKDSYFFDYEQKYMPGRATKFTPARCSAEITKKIQDTCIKVMQILDLKNIARIDGFLTNDQEIYITDPNSLAGMAPSSFVFRQAAEINMNHANFINHLIETELINYNMQDKINLNNNKLLNNNKKLKVGVLFGGRSHEKEISLESGRNIIYKLSPEKYEVIPLFLNSNLKIYNINYKLLVRNSTKEIESGLEDNMLIIWSELNNLVDFVFIGLHGGEGENGCIQGALEMLNIPYNGSSVLTSALCMDKYKTNKFLKSQNFYVPESLLLSQEEWQANQNSCLEKISNFFNKFPVIIKPHDDGCSVLVSKANNNQELITAVNNIFSDGKKFALIEEFIKAMELTVGVVGNNIVQALVPSQTIVSKEILSIEEKFLPGAGENQTPALLPAPILEFIRKTIEEVYISLNCKGYARIDCFYQNAQESPTKTDRVIILEVNTLPGMTPATCIFHQAAEVGMSPMNFIDLIIQLGLEEHKQEKINHEFVQQNFKQEIKQNHKQDNKQDLKENYKTEVLNKSNLKIFE